VDLCSTALAEINGTSPPGVQQSTELPEDRYRHFSARDAQANAFGKLSIAKHRFGEQAVLEIFFQRRTLFLVELRRR